MVDLFETIQLSDFERVVLRGESVRVSPETRNNINTTFDFLSKFSGNKVIYGINTGFGPMAQYRLDNDLLTDLQYNLIRSHSTGMGDLFAPEMARAVLLARLLNFIQGKSAVSTNVTDLLVEMVNRGIAPCIPEHGGVGASGDLVQLAHLALALIGEGNVYYNGKITAAGELFAELGIKPLQIRGREGIALINGTSAMTGVGLINTIYAKRALEISLLFSCMANEIMEAFDDHISVELNMAKRHDGQREIAAAARSVLKDSKLTKSREEHLYNKETDGEYIDKKVQEYYSMRCYPQILGPILDLLKFSEKVLVDEINSSNDNPITDTATGNVFHGGNFHGDYVSLEMDKMRLAVARLTMLTERQLNFLLNNSINKVLPPFINLCRLGLNFGLQGMQFTATSTTAENQTLSAPMYVHSIPCNNDNQDIVSMGCNSALLTKKAISNLYEVLAIQGIALAQAVDCLDIGQKLSGKTGKLYSEIRQICPVIKKDLPTYNVQNEVKNYLRELKTDNIFHNQ